MNFKPIKALSNAFLVLSIISIFYSCEEQIESPNILWISHEDLSPEYGCYGDPFAITPNIDSFAENALRFNNAYSNAPICAPARSTLITGVYATSLGTQHLRSEIKIPDEIKTLPELMRDAGYYTSNNVKTDYNFDPDNRWDECSNKAHWRNGPDDRPFFSVFNFGMTHEGPTNRLDPEDTKTVKEKVNPDLVVIPPYLPDSPKMREIWAHKYDLLSFFDQKAGELMEQLEEDGLKENTIVFIFSDHGTGLPGHKRWLNNAGLKVPFLLHVPQKYEKWLRHKMGEESNRLVGFVDFAPTVLEMAGADIPDHMEGESFARVDNQKKKYIYGYRDRADDCYDMARAVTDGRFIYVRHFMPHVPYYQNAVVFNKRGSYEEINRLRELDALPSGTKEMFAEKPTEILYDIKNDPYGQVNLAGREEFRSMVDTFRMKLDQWMLNHYDTGLLNEGQYMEMARTARSSVYEAVRSLGTEKMSEYLHSAKMVGTIQNTNEILPSLKSADENVLYWGLLAVDAFDGDISALKPVLTELLNSDSNVVASLSASILIKRFKSDQAYQRIGEMLQYDYEPVVLQTAINVRDLDTLVKPLLPLIRNEVFPKYQGDIWGRYRNWSYPMFIGMALDQARMNCGEAIDVNK